MAWNSLPDFIRDPTSSTDCFRRLRSRVTSASSAIGALNDYAMVQSHALTHSLTLRYGHDQRRPIITLPVTLPTWTLIDRPGAHHPSVWVPLPTAAACSVGNPHNTVSQYSIHVPNLRHLPPGHWPPSFRAPISPENHRRGPVT